MTRYTNEIPHWQPTITVRDHNGTRTIPRYNPGEAAPAAADPGTSLIRREDVISYGQGLLQTYTAQQNAALTVSGEIIDSRSAGAAWPRTSTAEELKERRKTSRLYLNRQTLTVAITVGGLAYLAHLAGAIDAGAAIAFWMFGTGAIALLLTTWQHGRELRLTPEAIAHAEIAANRSVAEIDAWSRSEIAGALGDSIRAQAATDQANAEARRTAAENEAARLWQQMDQRHAQRQQTRRAMLDEAGADAWPAAAPTVAETVYQTDPTVGATVETVSTAPPAAPADPTLALLLTTIAGLFETTDTANPLIRQALPWSARSTQIPPAEKERIAATLATIDPPIISTQAGAGGRSYLNVSNWTPRRAARAIAAAWRP